MNGFLNLTKPSFSLDSSPWGDSDEDQKLKEYVPADADTEEEAFRRIRSKTILEALATLSEREEKVLTHRFGLNGEEQKTLEETSHLFGITRERVRQIEEKALKKLRHVSRRRKLESWFE